MSEARATITQADLDRLVAEPSADSRVAIAEKVGALFEAGISDRERALAIGIFRAMARDAEVQVRAALSRRLKASPDLPHDVATKLAADVDQVSLPLLQFSPVLNEEDLVAIVRSGAVSKQSAVAQRQDLTGPVADVIVEVAAPPAVATLIANERAAVSDNALERALDRVGTEVAVQEAMAHRRMLPVRVAERLVALASESLRDYVATHHNLSEAATADLVLDARERATLGLSAAAADVRELIDHLFQSGRLTEAIIVRALCTGDFDFFEHALARMAGIPVSNSYRLTHDPAGLERLMQRCGLSKTSTAIALAAVETSRELQYDGNERDRQRYEARVIERVLTQFAHTIADDDAGYLLRRLAGLGTPSPESTPS